MTESVNLRLRGPLLQQARELAAITDSTLQDVLLDWLNKATPNVDHAAFVGDVVKLLGTLGDEKSSNATNQFKKLGGELTDLKVDGETATGKIDGKPIGFKRIDGRWYISVVDLAGAP